MSSFNIFSVTWVAVAVVIFISLFFVVAITPNDEDANWRIDIYGQNITDELNVMNVGDATAPLGMSKSIWARPQAT